MILPAFQQPIAPLALFESSTLTIGGCLPYCRDRVMNLYFAYLFVLRAVMKAAPVLTAYEYSTGLTEEDAQTQQLINQLVRASPPMTVA